MDTSALPVQTLSFDKNCERKAYSKFTQSGELWTAKAEIVSCKSGLKSPDFNDHIKYEDIN